MSFLSNAHTHTQYCDGRNTAREMLQAAQGRGFVSLGFSGHGAQGFDAAYAMDGGRQEAYRAELRALQAEEQDVRLWVGLEQDALVSAEQKAKNRLDFDYILGSTHYLCRDFQGVPVAVDGDLGPLKDYTRQTYGGDMLAAVQAYFDAHAAMVLTDRPDVIGHFDLIRKHAKRQQLFDPESAAYRKIALDALEAVSASGCVLEVNTGGMARGYLQEPYPTRELLLAWREMGGVVTLTSDCHSAALMDFAFGPTLAELKKLGYHSLRRLGAGDCLWEDVEC